MMTCKPALLCRLPTVPLFFSVSFLELSSVNYSLLGKKYEEGEQKWMSKKTRETAYSLYGLGKETGLCSTSDPRQFVDKDEVILAIYT
jgi:hypothetical protein